MSETPFFIAGGALPANTPSYVLRAADRELLRYTLDGAFCYVLAARQMGKSSLMLRTALRLYERGTKVSLVNLRKITSTVDSDWYLALLQRVQHDLGLKTDAQEWWQAKADLGVPQRFIDFLHDVVLREITGTIVLFIDEIDALIELDFRDDFFAAIRAIYHLRTSNAAYARLTFVMFGVSTPHDLIRDASRTPFTIGRAIDLREFSYFDATMLLQRLEQRHPGQGDLILRRIFYWTKGHPYLTQKLCLAADQARVLTWDQARIDELVEVNFFGAASETDPNLTFVRARMRGAPPAEQRALIGLYSAVYAGQVIEDDTSSPVQNQLKLYGLVRVEQSRLVVRNEIYRRLFDQQWIAQYAPPAPPPRLGSNTTFLYTLLGLLLAVVIGLSGFLWLNRTSGAAGATPTGQVALQASATAATGEPTTIVSSSPTAELPTAISATDIPSDTPAPATLIPSDTHLPTDIPTNKPTDTPVPPPPPLARCRVIQAANIHVQPNDSTNIGVMREDFVPLARDSTDDSIVWVQAAETAEHRAGWVYAGSNPRLISCSGLENVPLS